MPTLSSPAAHHIPASGIARLTQFGLIEVSGEEAATFLHGQLTNEIKTLAESHACLAGYCSPKGRLLATMLVWKNAGAVLLQTPLELQEMLQKRLQMYIMRSKVKLANISAHRVVLGILGTKTLAYITEWFPVPPTSFYESVSNQHGTLIRLPDSDGIARYQWLAEKEWAEQIWSALSANIPTLTEQIWALSDIHAGIPHVTLATQEKFVPQMINYELIGGVNFKKGCYPGQEIVARTHYLGKQKRRMVLSHIDSINVTSATEVFTADDPGQPCGMVVNAARNPAGGSDCLIEIKTEFYNQVTVQLGSGEQCQWLAMPYPLPVELTDDQPAS